MVGLWQEIFINALWDVSPAHAFRLVCCVEAFQPLARQCTLTNQMLVDGEWDWNDVGFVRFVLGQDRRRSSREGYQFDRMVEHTTNVDVLDQFARQYPFCPFPFIRFAQGTRHIQAFAWAVQHVHELGCSVLLLQFRLPEERINIVVRRLKDLGKDLDGMITKALAFDRTSVVAALRCAGASFEENLVCEIVGYVRGKGKGRLGRAVLYALRDGYRPTARDIKRIASLGSEVIASIEPYLVDRERTMLAAERRSFQRWMSSFCDGEPDVVLPS